MPLEGVVLEEPLTKELVRLKHAPGKESAHVQGANPGHLKNVIRQIKTELGPRQPLSLGQKIWLMLQGRDLLQQRNDAIKTTFDLKLIGLKPLIGLLIRQRVKILRPGQGRAAEIDRCTRLGLTTSDPTGLRCTAGRRWSALERTRPADTEPLASWAALPEVVRACLRCSAESRVVDSTDDLVDSPADP